MKIFGPLIFALIAAVGNGFFAAGQKKAIGLENSLTFIILSLLICIVLTTMTAPLFGQMNYLNTIKANYLWILVSGFGLFLTYIGFNILYFNYGASNYVLYAVLSIVTTSVIVGVFIFKESINIYHWLAILLAMITVMLFSWGNYVGRA